MPGAKKCSAKISHFSLTMSISMTIPSFPVLVFKFKPQSGKKPPPSLLLGAVFYCPLLGHMRTHIHIPACTSRAHPHTRLSLDHMALGVPGLAVLWGKGIGKEPACRFWPEHNECRTNGTVSAGSPALWGAQ